MFPHYHITATRFTIIRSWSMPALVLLVLVGATLTAQAQNNFNSGSTGIDGAFAPTTSQSLQVPESGVFNYTTFNVPAGVTITYTRNTQNTPVTILASGSVTIAGSLAVSGQNGNANGSGGIGGPGGANGGLGGFGNGDFSGTTGNGPGGGGPGKKLSNYPYPGGGGGGGFSVAGSNGGGGGAGIGGASYGAATLLPLIGGSGGGGGGAYSTTRGGGGGGGGGAILIASSGSITFSGTGAVSAQGGNGNGLSSGGYHGGGGGGAGGAIRLVATTVSGNATLNVNGGAAGSCYNGGCGGAGALGFIRVEAYDYGGFTTNVQPSGLSYALPNPAILTNSPQLLITSVAGVAAPASPLGSFQGAPDIIVPASQANPVTVALSAANMPVGAVIQVTLIPASGTRTTVSSSALSGTEAASTATASLTLPTGMSVITATAVIDLTVASARPLFMDGERINRVEVAAVYGGPSEVTYVTQSGRRIKRTE